MSGAMIGPQVKIMAIGWRGQNKQTNKTNIEDAKANNLSMLPREHSQYVLTRSEHVPLEGFLKDWKR